MAGSGETLTGKGKGEAQRRNFQFFGPEWQKRDGIRIKAVSQPPDKRDRNAEAVNVTRVAAIDKRISEID